MKRTVIGIILLAGLFLFYVESIGEGLLIKKKEDGVKAYDDDLPSLIKKYQSRQVDPNKWLFIIAVEDYDMTDRVIYAKNSASSFKTVAQKVFGIDDRHTYALIDGDATAGSIKVGLERLLVNVEQGHTIYFYYSGHGVPDPYSEDAFILPRDKVPDFIFRDEEFKLSNIYRKLSGSKAGKVIAFIDASFSGKAEFNKDKMVVFTAGKDNQFSNSYDQKGHRMFSYYLMRGLMERGGADLDMLYKYVSVKVHDSSLEKGDMYLQDPQIEGNVRSGL